ncbi:NAC domain-containing protein 6 [Capsella rubella]|nr:NAC domain-containing protein 6 [Capsella rubella]
MLRGEYRGRDFIGMEDVYAKEPWLLNQTNHPILQEDEWYYFTTKTQISKEKVGCGKYSKRKIIGDDGTDLGNWSANGTKDIIDEETGDIIGIRQNLTYHSPRKSKKHKRGDGGAAPIDVSCSWIMDEFRLPTDKDNETFQELVLCKIHKKKWCKKKGKGKEIAHHEEDEDDEDDEEIVPCKKHTKRKSKKKKEFYQHDDEASTSTSHYDQHDPYSSWEQQQQKEALKTSHYGQHEPSSYWEEQQQKDTPTIEKELTEITGEGGGDWTAYMIEKLMADVDGTGQVPEKASTCTSHYQQHESSSSWREEQQQKDSPATEKDEQVEATEIRREDEEEWTADMIEELIGAPIF